jgi:hypothetical protein
MAALILDVDSGRRMNGRLHAPADLPQEEQCGVTFEWEAG